MKNFILAKDKYLQQGKNIEREKRPDFKKKTKKQEDIIFCIIRISC